MPSLPAGLLTTITDQGDSLSRWLLNCCTNDDFSLPGETCAIETASDASQGRYWFGVFSQPHDGDYQRAVLPASACPLLLREDGAPTAASEPVLNLVVTRALRCDPALAVLVSPAQTRQALEFELRRSTAAALDPASCDVLCTFLATHLPLRSGSFVAVAATAPPLPVVALAGAGAVELAGRRRARQDESRAAPHFLLGVSHIVAVEGENSGAHAAAFLVTIFTTWRFIRPAGGPHAQVRTRQLDSWVELHHLDLSAASATSPGSGAAASSAAGAAALSALRSLVASVASWTTTTRAVGHHRDASCNTRGAVNDSSAEVQRWGAQPAEQPRQLTVLATEVYTWGDPASARALLGRPIKATTVMRVDIDPSAGVPTAPVNSSRGSSSSGEGGDASVHSYVLSPSRDSSPPSAACAPYARDALSPGLVINPASSPLGPWRVVAVSCAWYHAVCCTDVGTVYTWGLGADGALGHGDESASLTPRMVEFFGLHHPLSATAVAAGADAMGAHTLVLAQGRLSSEMSTGALEPPAVGAAGGAAAAPQPVSHRLGLGLATGGGSGSNTSSCPGGRVFAFGVRAATGVTHIEPRSGSNSGGSSGGARDSGPTSSFFAAPSAPFICSPALVCAPSTDMYDPQHGGVISVAAGGGYSLALTASGAAYAWGIGTGGRLGVGASNSHLSESSSLSLLRRAVGAPTVSNTQKKKRKSFGGAASIVAGDRPIAPPRRVLSPMRISTGWEQQQQLSFPTPGHAMSPAPLTLNPGGAQVAAGAAAAGSPHDGSSGVSPPFSYVVSADGGPSTLRMQFISAGESHGCAIDVYGRLWAWGRGDSGQLGIGTLQSALSPQLVRVPSLSLSINTTSGSGNGSSGSGSTHDGSISGTTTNYNLPQIRFKSVSCGTSHTLAVDEDGGVWAWGGCGGALLGLGVSGLALDWDRNTAKGAGAGTDGSASIGNRSSGDASPAAREPHLFTVDSSSAALRSRIARLARRDISSASEINRRSPDHDSDSSDDDDDDASSGSSDDDDADHNYADDDADELALNQQQQQQRARTGRRTGCARDEASLPRQWCELMRRTRASVNTGGSAADHPWPWTLPRRLPDFGTAATGSAVAATSAAAVSVSAGLAHSMAITESGRAYVWGATLLRNTTPALSSSYAGNRATINDARPRLVELQQPLTQHTPISNADASNIINNSSGSSSSNSNDGYDAACSARAGAIAGACGAYCTVLITGGSMTEEGAGIAAACRPLQIAAVGASAAMWRARMKQQPCHQSSPQALFDGVLSAVELSPIGAFDCVLRVGNESFPAHRALLCARSVVLRERIQEAAAFALRAAPQQSSDENAAAVRIVSISLYDVSVPVARLLLEWLYTDNIRHPPRPVTASLLGGASATSATVAETGPLLLSSLREVACRYALWRLAAWCTLSLDAPIARWTRQQQLQQQSGSGGEDEVLLEEEPPEEDEGDEGNGGSEVVPTLASSASFWTLSRAAKTMADPQHGLVETFSKLWAVRAPVSDSTSFASSPVRDTGVGASPFVNDEHRTVSAPSKATVSATAATKSYYTSVSEKQCSSTSGSLDPSDGAMMTLTGVMEAHDGAEVCFTIPRLHAFVLLCACPYVNARFLANGRHTDDDGDDVSRVEVPVPLPAGVGPVEAARLATFIYLGTVHPPPTSPAAAVALCELVGVEFAGSWEQMSDAWRPPFQQFYADLRAAGELRMPSYAARLQSVICSYCLHAPMQPSQPSPLALPLTLTMSTLDASAAGSSPVSACSSISARSVGTSSATAAAAAGAADTGKSCAMVCSSSEARAGALDDVVHLLANTTPFSSLHLPLAGRALLDYASVHLDHISCLSSDAARAMHDLPVSRVWLPQPQQQQQQPMTPLFETLLNDIMARDACRVILTTTGPSRCGAQGAARVVLTAVSRDHAQQRRVHRVLAHMRSVPMLLAESVWLRDDSLDEDTTTSAVQHSDGDAALQSRRDVQSGWSGQATGTLRSVSLSFRRVTGLPPVAALSFCGSYVFAIVALPTVVVPWANLLVVVAFASFFAFRVPDAAESARDRKGKSKL